VGVGYFFVWTAFGIAVLPLGAALAAVVMQLPALTRAVPIAVGVVALIAGALQFTAWKAHHLACCREAPGRGRTLPADSGTAWRHGLHCSHCCANLMAILLVIGSWTFAQWLSWRQQSPSNVSYRPVANASKSRSPRGERLFYDIGEQYP
jgi:predicted metal-binding membrane protein